MTGPEHYREAERLLRPHPHADGSMNSPSDYELSAAQVHATLALAAATARQSCLSDGGDLAMADWNNWRDAIAPKPQGGAA